MWLSASKAMPPERAASPMTATIFSSPPDRSRASAKPSATDSESDAWPDGCTSKGLSSGFGKPDRPP